MRYYWSVEGEDQVYAILLLRLYKLVIPLVLILSMSMRKANFW